MKKKLLMILLTAIIACVGVLGLSACDSYTYSDSGLIYRMVDKRYVVYGIQGNSDTTEVVIPARFENTDVAGIAREAFKGNNKIVSVTIQSSGDSGVRSIAASAFENCTALVSVVIPSSVKLLGTYLFKGCTALKSVTLPTNLNTLSGGTFYGCTSLTTITLPTSTRRISDNAFEKSGLTTITLPNSLTEIGERAFAECESLASVTLSTSLTIIGRYAFTKCDLLTAITLPESVNTIGEWAFTESGLLTATFTDTELWRAFPHNYATQDDGEVLDIDSADLADTELAARYLLNNYSSDEDTTGYANYTWYKN